MKHVMRPSLAAVAVIAALAVADISQAQATAAAPAVTTKVTKAQASQIVGYELAERYPTWARDMVDPQLVGQAVTRALQGLKPTMSKAKLRTVDTAFQQELKAAYDRVSAANGRAGAAFLAKNKTQPGVKVTADGLQYQVISQGTGPRPTATDTVQVNYTGSLINGRVFDASARRGLGPVKVDLAKVFPGLREGLLLMPVGSHYEFAIPPDLAYGAHPKNGFPPNETLLFDVTLVKISAH